MKVGPGLLDALPPLSEIAFHLSRLFFFFCHPICWVGRSSAWEFGEGGGWPQLSKVQRLVKGMSPTAWVLRSCVTSFVVVEAEHVPLFDEGVRAAIRASHMM